METQGSRTAAVTKSQELTRVIHQMFAAIPQQYIHRQMLTMSTRFNVVDATPG